MTTNPSLDALRASVDGARIARVQAGLRVYTQLCADPAADKVAALTWTALGALLESFVSCLGGNQAVFVADRAKDCHQRADLARRLIDICPTTGAVQR